MYRFFAQSGYFSKYMSAIFAGLCLVLPVLSKSASSAAADSNIASTVIVNASILTMDDRSSRFTGMALSGDRILALGTDEEILTLAGPETVVQDAHGRTVMPAFVDAHVHTMSIAQMRQLTDVGLERFGTVEAALASMIQHAKKAESGDWLLFRNVDFGTQESHTGKLTAEMLDKVSRDKPVFVLHAGGHISSVNTKVLKLMGIDRDTPDPAAGGSFGRTESGDPDGMLYGFATLSALEVIEPLKQLDTEAAMGRISEEFAQVGIGTVGDAGIGAMGDPGELDSLRALAKSGTLTFRVRGYLSFGLEKHWTEAGITPGYGDDRVRVVGYKLSADGSNQARTGLQREPYPGTKSRGIAYMSEDQMYASIKDKTAAGFQLAMHGNGDAAIDNILSAVAKLREEGTVLVRPRIEHCSIVQDDQLLQLKELEVSCSFLIGHVYLWGGAFKDRVFGLEKAEKLDRTGSFERAGVPYSLHTDNAVTEFSPLEMVEIAVRRELFSEPGYILAPAERASREMALRAITSTAAWQLLSETEIGTLEPGKYADFVILDGDPMTVPDDAIGDIQVLETWVAGEQVFRFGNGLE